jgi:hypothetical protein
MNGKIFIVLCFIASGLHNCKKETPEPNYFKSLVDLEPLTYFPNSLLCTATKEVPGLGSISWTANCEAYIVDNTLQIRVTTVQDTIDKGTREEIYCGYIPLRQEYYSVGTFNPYAQPVIYNTFGTYSRLLDDGDVLDAHWTVDESEQNFIEITNLDLDSKRVEGRFDLYFLMKTQGTHGIMYSEQINFKTGNFKARITE